MLSPSQLEETSTAWGSPLLNFLKKYDQNEKVKQGWLFSTAL